MRLLSSLLVPLAGLVTAVLVLPAGADPYQRRWFTVDGGGLTTNAYSGAYRLAGTIGQPDAGVLLAGPLRLRGGFWSGSPGTGWVSVPGKPEAPPTAFRLYPPAPNPANGSATIDFALPDRRDVVVRVADVQGRLVRELARTSLAAGRHRLAWDGRDGSGALAPSGLYFIDADTGLEHAVTRLVLLTDGGHR